MLLPMVNRKYLNRHLSRHAATLYQNYAGTIFRESNTGHGIRTEESAGCSLDSYMRISLTARRYVLVPRRL